MIIAFILVYNYFYTTEEVLLDAEGEGTIEEDGEEKSNTKSAIDKIGIMQEKEEFIEVHMIGEVNDPGVVKLKVGSRIIDAINAAGGKTDKADISEINLAYVLDDGVRLYIPSFSEMKEKKLDNSTNSKDTISSDTGVSNIVMEEVSVEKNNTNEIKKININKASKEELKQLSGVGDSVAQAIIDYRQKNGKFNTIEDIKKVPGIGESKFSNIQKMISVK